MSLRNKIAFTIVLVMVLSTLAYCLIFRTMILKSLDSLESRFAEQSMKRCVTALEISIENLDRTVNTWASRSEIHTFTRTLSRGHIDENLTPDTFKSLNVDLIRVFDRNGKILWGKTFDHTTGREIPLEPALDFKPERPYRPARSDGSLNPEILVIQTRYGPMIIASRPILTRYDQGPSHGTFVMGRLLSGQRQKTLSALAGTDVKILPGGEYGKTVGNRPAGQFLSTEESFKVLKSSPDSLQASATVKGPAGEPVLQLEASFPRNIKVIGKRAYAFGLIFIIGTGIVVLLVISAMLRALVLKPLSTLTGNVLSMGDSAHDTRRFETRRKDEIGTLSREFAAMVERLSRSEQRYRFLAQNAQDVIWAMDLDKSLTYVSPSVEALSGFSVEESLGKRLEEILPAESLNKAMDLLGERLPRKIDHLPEGTDWLHTLELEMLRKDGSTIWTEVTVNLIYNDEGATTGIMGITRNISERKRAEEEKKKIQEQLLQTQKMEALGRFAGGIAHDLNNILYPIIINTEALLQETEHSSDTYQALKQTLDAAYRQKDLVKHILSFSRKSDSKFGPIRVMPLVQETLNFLRSTLPSTIEIRQYLQASPDTIIGDSTQIAQVIMNLCRNAADSIESGTGTLEVSLTNTHLEPVHSSTEMKAGPYLLLTVADTGSGMDPDILDRIFEPFFTTKEIGKGSGMGLAIVHGIVHDHSGVISVESKAGKGSLFTVYLPLCEETPRNEALQTDKNVTDGMKRRILLVDDEESILSCLKRALQRSGYDVITLNDSCQALELFSRLPNHFDLVITDQTMPKMTGSQLAVQLMDIRPDIPVILSSGFIEAIDEKEAKGLGIRGFLLKPASSHELNTLIGRLLTR